uniref:Uncharacterized protein n=1 Tax=Anguilla anguilla TaxID=7936 RepID=A0A0E9V3L5_ANGAN
MHGVPTAQGPSVTSPASNSFGSWN